MYKEKAVDVFRRSISEQGFLATSSGKENYNRVWSRDSAITALAICLHQDKSLYPAIKQSILTLAAYQLENGLIPSNVGLDESGKPLVSYGTLVGRVDAQTWWIIQSCLYIKVAHDEALKKELYPKIKRTLALLEAWEYNARHLIYTPLGGNWADEYILSGYTLYDNSLRYLALHLCAILWPEEFEYRKKADLVHQVLQVNFSDTNSLEKFLLHPRSKNDWERLAKPYLAAAFDAAQYLPFFDAAANGLSALLGIKNNNLPQQIDSFLANPNIGFVPAFWPVINEQMPEWQLLRNQYNYSFKNFPYHFHNGGSWPVMSGILSLGLRMNGEEILADHMKNSYEYFLEQVDHFQFSEYISVSDRKPGGKKDMCFSAAGYLFLCSNKEQIISLLEL